MGELRRSNINAWPDVSAAFIKRKQLQGVPDFTVGYRHVPLLHVLSADLDAGGLAAEFVDIVERGTDQEAAQAALERALQQAALTAAPDNGERHANRVALDDPRIMSELATQLAQEIYAIEIIKSGVADAVGRTAQGQPVTVEISATRGDRIRLHARLLASPPQHLLVFKLHCSRPCPVFEIIYDGPFEGAAKLGKVTPVLPRKNLRESEKSYMDVALKVLRELNRGIPTEMGLQKR